MLPSELCGLQLVKLWKLQRGLRKEWVPGSHKKSDNRGLLWRYPMPYLETDQILPRALLPKGLSGNQYYNEFDLHRVDVSKLAEVISESTLLFLRKKKLLLFFFRFQD